MNVSSLAAASMASIGPSPIEAFANVFNSNPYFIGLMMLLLNLGGRFIMLEVTKEQEKFFQNPWVRRFLIFTVLFVATRNLIVAAIMTLVMVLFLGYLFNENSSLCLFGKTGGTSTTCGTDGQKKETLTVEEMEILSRLSAKAQKFAQSDAKKEDDKGNLQDLPTKVYGINLGLIQKA
jgi:hypothetical protein